MHIERTSRKSRSVPMTPLIDVVFLLLIFFMLSTTFTQSESLELKLPAADEVSSQLGIVDEKLLQVFVASDGSLYLGRKAMSEEMLVESLSQTVKKLPDIGILLLSGPRVSVQQLVKAIDLIYLAGAGNLSVASWEPEPTNH